MRLENFLPVCTLNWRPFQSVPNEAETGIWETVGGSRSGSTYHQFQ